jgi:hypothetical protein
MGSNSGRAGSRSGFPWLQSHAERFLGFRGSCYGFSIGLKFRIFTLDPKRR